MDKDQLRNYIIKLELPSGLEDVIVDLIDSSSEVNKPLLDAIADLLENQASFYEKNVEILEEEAAMYEELASELSALDEEAYADKMEIIANFQEELLRNLNGMITTSATQDSTIQNTPETAPVEAIAETTTPQEIQQAPQTMEAPAPVEQPFQTTENDQIIQPISPENTQSPAVVTNTDQQAV